MDPGIDAFHIHHVVATFQTNMVIYVRPKNFLLLLTFDSSHSNGIHAKKIRKVKGETGHAVQSNKPLPVAMNRLVKRFKTNVCVKIVV